MDLRNIIGRIFTDVKEMPERGGITLSDGVTTVYISGMMNRSGDVELEDMVGDLTDLMGNPILRAEERRSDTQGGEWTFYEMATILGSVTLRFYGPSNDHYSGEADVWEEECPKKNRRRKVNVSY